MKTLTFGLGNDISHIPSLHATSTFSQYSNFGNAPFTPMPYPSVLRSYKTNRANGDERKDCPPWSFPEDGKYDWAPEPGKPGYYRTRYTEGPRDRLWMEERDRNYVFRLEREDTLDATEPNLKSECPKLYDEVMAERAKKAKAIASAQHQQHANNNNNASTTVSTPTLLSPSITARSNSNIHAAFAAETFGNDLTRYARLVTEAGFSPNAEVSFLHNPSKPIPVPISHQSLKETQLSSQEIVILKTMHFGISPYTCYLLNNHFTPPDLESSFAIQAYREHRENGIKSDSPHREFPEDGEREWISETNNRGIYRVKYTEGPGDKKWMEEKDQNYLNRLKREQETKKKNAATSQSNNNNFSAPSQNLSQPTTPTLDPYSLPSFSSLSINSLQNIAMQDIQQQELIGSGGFGDVYRATWHKQNVAVKQLHLKKMTDDILEDFKQEAKLMATLHFPNIVHLLGICLEVGHYAMVMEYLSKGSLYHVLHDTKEILPWASPLRWQIAMEIGQGLSYLHNKSILHRDLKSLNILLDENYHAKISDFGLSKLKLETSSTTTTQSKVMGSTRWLAPELFTRRASATKSSDVYSYGMVLWEIASRTIPFKDAQNDTVAMGWIKDGEKEEVPTDCPSAYADIIQKCWLVANARPNAQEIVDALEKAEQFHLKGKEEISNDNNEPSTSSNTALSDAQGQTFFGGTTEQQAVTSQEQKTQTPGYGSIAMAFMP